MNRRDNQLTTYVDDDLYAEIERRARDQNTSKSEVVAMAIERGIHEDLLDEVSRQTDAERRIEQVVDRATDEIEATAETTLDEIQAHLQLMNSVLLRTGMYSRGTWELVQENHGDVIAKQAMQTASQSFKRDADAMGLDINALGARRQRSQSRSALVEEDDTGNSRS